MSQSIRTSVGTSNNKRVTMRVVIDQVTDGAYVITQLTVGIVKLQRRVLWLWFNATADSITLAGAFSGPRSPRDVNGNNGYYFNNPFQKTYSAETIHFKDFSPAQEPLYTIDHAQYSITAFFGDKGTSATVQW